MSKFKVSDSWQGTIFAAYIKQKIDEWYKTEILWVIRYPCMTSAESLDAVWTRNTIPFHTAYLTFDNMKC